MNLSIKTLRQSAAILLAHSVCALFPKTTVLNVQTDGCSFTCDFRLNQQLDDEAMLQIEEKIRQTIFEDASFKEMEMMRDNAVAFLEHHKLLKLASLVKKNPENVVKIVQFEGFYAPSEAVVPSSKEVGFVKLLEKVESNGIVRIRGAVYPNQQKLKKFLKIWEKYKKINHQKLGEELNLFFDDKGWNWLPRGMDFRGVLTDWWKSAMLNRKFSFIEGDPAKIFHKEKVLKAKYNTLSAVEGEYQPSLFDNGSFTRDRSYIFCSPDEVVGELISSLQFFKKTSNIFGFETQWHLVVSKGDKKKFDPLARALKEEEVDYVLDTLDVRVASPRIEGRVVDLLGREWPAFSLELNQKKHTLITEELFGSIERIAALLIEKYAGQFPLWLAPEQVRVIPVKVTHHEYGQKVQETLVEAGYRVGYCLSEENLSAKVHSAVQSYIPYMLIVGEKEMNKDRVAVRSWNKDETPKSVTLEEFLDELGTIMRKETFES